MPDLPEGLVNVLLKALERRPEDRYQNMSEFADALENLTGGQTLMAGAKVEDDQAGKTVLARGGMEQDGELAKVLEGSGSQPIARAIPQIPAPPEKRRQPSIKVRRWIPVAGLAVLLFIGVVAGAGLVIRGLQGKVPQAGLATLAAASTPAQSTLPGSQAALSNPDPGHYAGPASRRDQGALGYCAWTQDKPGWFGVYAGWHVFVSGASPRKPKAGNFKRWSD